MTTPMRLVPAELVDAILAYLNLQPRGQVNAIATALENCQTVVIQPPEEEVPE